MLVNKSLPQRILKSPKFGGRYGIVGALAFLYGCTMVLQLLNYSNLHWLLLPLKLICVAVFVALTRRHDDQALFFFLSSVIISGVNGSFHLLFPSVPLSIVFLVILLVRVITSSEKRLLIFSRLRTDPITMTIVVSGLVIPLLGIIRGIQQNNNMSYLLQDADGWFFYLCYFCLLGLITTTEQFFRMLNWIMSSIIFVAAVLVCFEMLYLLNLLSPPVIELILYKTLNLGGHLILWDNGFLRIYTGNGIFLPWAFCYFLLKMFQSRGISMPKWLVLILLTGLALFVTYTRGYWIAAIIAAGCAFFCLSFRSKLKLIVILGLIVCFFWIMVYEMFGLTPGKIFRDEWQKIAIARRQIHETPALFQTKDSNDLGRIPSGGYPTTLKIKQYYAQILYTRDKPIFGHGFGATLPGKVTYRDGEDNKPFILEAGYGNLFMKVGFVGFFLWSGILVSIITVALRRSVARSFPQNVFVFSLIGFIITFATNPYLFSPFGITIIVVTAFVTGFPRLDDDFIGSKPDRSL